MATTRAGIRHTMTAGRLAQLHRWQLLGAAARRGRRTARTEIYRASRAKGRKEILRPALRATAWGVSKLAVPTSLVTPIIPGYQLGDRTYMAPRGLGRNKRR
jgi:hypothetical protein